MCNCVERALTLLRREHGNDELEIEGLAYSIGSENRPVDQFLTCCYSYRKRNKNGDFYKNLDTKPQASYDAFGSKSPQIRELHVKIGRLSGVEAHYLQNCYEVFRAGTVCENADLIIHTQEIVVKCKNCGFSGDLAQNDFSCPRCKSSEISVIDGEDMYLMRLVIE